MQYRFTSMASLADYLAMRGTQWRESANGAKSKSKGALLLERAVTYEMIADMVRNTVIAQGATDVTVHLNPQGEKK